MSGNVIDMPKVKKVYEVGDEVVCSRTGYVGTVVDDKPGWSGAHIRFPNYPRGYFVTWVSKVDLSLVPQEAPAHSVREADLKLQKPDGT